jgi:hypothetical protein
VTVRQGEERTRRAGKMEADQMVTEEHEHDVFEEEEEEDDDDEVVREVSVYVSNNFTSDELLYILQYPLRPASRPYVQTSDLREVRIKVRQGPCSRPSDRQHAPAEATAGRDGVRARGVRGALELLSRALGEALVCAAVQPRPLVDQLRCCTDAWGCAASSSLLALFVGSLC